MAKRKGQRASSSDLFADRGLKVGDHVLLGGTVASTPGGWYPGTLLWVGKEEILIQRSTQNGETYTQHSSIYAVRAVGDVAELIKIREFARVAVKQLTDAVHEAESELGRARDALHSKLEELQAGGLKIEAFDQVADEQHTAEQRAIGERLDEETFA